jgi:hypothetical protein
MISQKNQPAETGHECLPSALTSPLKIWMHHPPHEKRTGMKYTKSWQHFEHLRTAMARTGRYEEEASHKAGVGANCPRMKP